MNLNPPTILAELQALRSVDPPSTLQRFRELEKSLELAIETENRHGPAGMAVALAQQAIKYLYEGIETEQNEAEIKRRFAVAIRRVEGWAMASAQARPDDPRLARTE
jgi:hypothetical protein